MTYVKFMIIDIFIILSFYIHWYLTVWTISHGHISYILYICAKLKVNDVFYTFLFFACLRLVNLIFIFIRFYFLSNSSLIFDIDPILIQYDFMSPNICFISKSLLVYRLSYPFFFSQSLYHCRSFFTDIF